MIFYDISSIKFSPALLDKNNIYIYNLLICSIWLCQKPIPMRMISVALKKNISQVIRKHGLKKVLCVNQLRNKYKYSLVSLLKP